MSLPSTIKKAIATLLANPSLLTKIIKDPLNPKNWETPKGRATARKRKSKK